MSLGENISRCESLSSTCAFYCTTSRANRLALSSPTTDHLQGERTGERAGGVRTTARRDPPRWKRKFFSTRFSLFCQFAKREKGTRRSGWREISSREYKTCVVTAVRRCLLRFASRQTACTRSPSPLDTTYTSLTHTVVPQFCNRFSSFCRRPRKLQKTTSTMAAMTMSSLPFKAPVAAPLRSSRRAVRRARAVAPR